MHIPRLQSLYQDLAGYYKGVLPLNHPAMIPFRVPLPPTTAALLTARQHLSQLAATMLTRCAPVRDATLKKTLDELADERRETLPERLVEAFKDLFDLGLLMSTDLSRAMLASVSDEKLDVEVLRAAREKEREIISKVYGLRVVCQKWRMWLEEVETRPEGQSWTRRLIRALGEDVAVSCPLPPDSQDVKNALPPVFFFTLFDLIYLQNYLQALVIAAVLRTLVPLRRSTAPSASLTSSSPQPMDIDGMDTDIADRTFTERVLSLLSSEVDDITSNPSIPTQTKLAHLADEVDRELREREYQPPTTKPSSQDPPILSTKDKVEKLLHPENPVFKLLRKRLLDTLADAMERIMEAYERQDTYTGRTRVPQTMKTGRDRKRPRVNHEPGVLQVLGLDTSDAFARPKEVGTLRRFFASHIKDQTKTIKIEPKGYEDPVLRKGIEKAMCDLADCVEWVRDVWKGLGLKGIDEVYDDENEDERRCKSPGANISSKD